MASHLTHVLIGALSAALLLTGCAPADEPTETAAVADQPSYDVSEGGAAIDAAQVSTNFGEQPEVELPSEDLVGENIERTLVVEGDGAPITSESIVVFKQQVYDIGTGEFGPYEPFAEPLQLNNPELLPYLPASLDGVPSGSRVAVVIPAEVMLGTTTGAENIGSMLLVMDVQEIAIGQAAEGEPQSATQDLVTVSSTPGEQPEIEVHSDQPAPTDQVIDVTIKGDGPLVEAGDYVTVQYTGLLFSDGTEFDSSWSRGGTPTAFMTTQVVPGFGDALVGQTVGSRVTTIFPPELGYGDQDGGAIPPGSTLVFVIDIIATM